MISYPNNFDSFFLMRLTGLDNVNSDSWDEAFLVILAISLTLLFFLFTSFFKGFSLLLLLGPSFLGPSLWFIHPSVFYGVALSASLREFKLVAMQILLIHILDV